MIHSYVSSYIENLWNLLMFFPYSFSIVLTELQAFLATRCSVIILILMSIYQTRESKDNLLSLRMAQSLGAGEFLNLYLVFTEFKPLWLPNYFLVFSGTEVSLSVFASIDALVAPIVTFFQKVSLLFGILVSWFSYLFSTKSRMHNITKTLLYRTKIKSKHFHL